MDADPRELRNSHVLVLDPMLHFSLFRTIAEWKGHNKSLKRHHSGRANRHPPHPKEGGDTRVCGELSGQRKRSAPTMMPLPSGSLQIVSLPVLSAVDLCLVIKIELDVAQGLLNIAHNLAFRKEGYPRSVRNFIKYFVR